MAKFSYVALDSRGKEITGVMESENSTAAVSRIREMGYFPTNVAEADKAATKKGYEQRSCGDWWQSGWQEGSRVARSEVSQHR